MTQEQIEEYIANRRLLLANEGVRVDTLDTLFNVTVAHQDVPDSWRFINTTWQGEDVAVLRTPVNEADVQSVIAGVERACRWADAE